MRRLDAAGKSIVASVAERDGEASEMVENAERLLFKVAHDERAADFREIREILDDELVKLEDLVTGRAEVTGTPPASATSTTRPAGSSRATSW